MTAEDLIELHRAIAQEFGGEGGVIENEFDLANAIQRPQATVFGRDAYQRFFEKAAAFFFALVSKPPFASANMRLAVASLLAFCELNGREIDFRVLDEATIERLVKRAASVRERGASPEEVFTEIRTLMFQAISPAT